ARDRGADDAPAPAVASLGVVLGDLSATGTGAVAVSSSVAATIGPATLVSSGAAAVSASTDSTLGGLTAGGTAAASVTAQVSHTLGPLTLMASAEVGTIPPDESGEPTVLFCVPGDTRVFGVR